jgi:serine/threonine protein kinase
MLTFNPEKRISVADALRHPYLSGLHNPKKELDCKQAFDFEFEKIDMTKDALQGLSTSYLRINVDVIDRYPVML